MNYEPFTSIENPTLAHFRHFSSLFTLSHLYTCRESSTNQLLFMQNKPNLVRRRRIASSVYTKDYENKWQWKVRKNKPNSNPIKPNLQKAKMNINSIIAKDYRKKDDFEVRINKPNSNPISEKPKIDVNLYILKDYENKTALRPQKNKPKQSQSFCAIGIMKINPHSQQIIQRSISPLPSVLRRESSHQKDKIALKIYPFGINCPIVLKERLFTIYGKDYG